MPLKNAAAAAAQPGAGAPDLGRIGSLQEALEFIDLWRSASPSIDPAHEGQVLEASMMLRAGSVIAQLDGTSLRTCEQVVLQALVATP